MVYLIYPIWNMINHIFDFQALTIMIYLYAKKIANFLTIKTVKKGDFSLLTHVGTIL